MYKFALIGYPISQSLSAVIHKAAFESTGLEGSYELLETPPEDLIDRLKFLKSNGYNGFNVTIPHKVPIVLFLNGFDPIANAAGSTNTIKIKNDKTFAGYNSDVYGFYEATPQDIRTNLAGRKVAILGAGGAARAIVIALMQMRVAEIDFYVRNIPNVSDLLDNLQKNCPTIKVNAYQIQTIKDLSQYSMLINATPLGMISKAMGVSPIDENILRTLPKDAVVYDIVYNPIQTELLRLAKKNHLHTISGIDMLVYQAAKSFEIWTGVKPDFKSMKIAALEALLMKNY